MTYLDSSAGPIVCGHRGAAAVAPENTLAAFAIAVERGATWVEFDVRPAAGGTLVVHHDPVTADGRVVAETAPADLPTSIPTLAALAALAPGIGFDLEMKTDRIGIGLGAFVDLVIATVDRHHADRRLMVTSFDDVALELLRGRRPDIATGLLFHDRAGDWAIARAVDTGHVAIAPWYRLVTAELVDDAHNRGLSVATWTVNDPASIGAVAVAGVDMIIGDDPAMIVQALAAGRS